MKDVQFLRIVGIDPGVTGAWAVINGSNMVCGDLPVAVIGAYKQIIAADLASLFSSFIQPDVVVIENNAANGGNGSLANFSMGLSMGVVLGVTGAMSYPTVRMKPMEWKRLVGLNTIKGTATARKEASRQRALEIWPEHEGLARKMDHNRADAALIALAEQRRRSG